jgi:hypothetical protein
MKLSHLSQSTRQLHDPGSQLLSKSDVFLKHRVIVRIDSAWFFAWGFNVTRESRARYSLLRH